ncbi:MAG: lysophospholipid acyltransferase family protein [Planctomycetota bacterium]|nr:lysophospholipid acyltransferase family protein [Planctomycetota bacterium]
MGRTKKHAPPWIEWPAAALIRSAMFGPLVIGLDPARHVARSLGTLYPGLQPSRFQRAVRNLRDAYPEWSDEQVRRTAVGAYQHLFQLGVEFMYTPRLITSEGFPRHLIFTQIGGALEHMLSTRPCILVTGHCGNWELMGYAVSMLGFPMHAVYRPLDLRPLDRWMRETRMRRGLTLVSKFGAVKALPPLVRAGFPIGLVADQSGGDRGVFVPFFGRLTSTYKSIGMLALQTGATIICGASRRLPEGEDPPPGVWQTCPGPDPRERWGEGSLRYVIEIVDTFGPDDYMRQPDPLYYLTARYRRGIETMVRNAPEQYFWMHRVWRSRPLHERSGKPFPAHLRAKLEALPWMTPEAVRGIVDRSDADRADLARLQR